MELVLECPEHLAEIVRQATETIMVEAGNYYLTNMKIKASAHIGNSWGEAK
ncbi:MAG TPA: hypothetical protein PKD00_00330 [Burkholderiales bacterium]|nr:hypothetical protein [Burkholderiales bacterium]